MTADPEALTRFYSDGVGLTVISHDAEEVELGLDGEVLLHLIPAGGAGVTVDDSTQAGLYHSAFLFGDRSELAGAVLRTATRSPGSYQGSADHLVSEAFYFTDPEGNGVELYADRPASEWEWKDGLVTMGSEVLDPNSFIAEQLGDAAFTPPATDVTLGHVHLRGGTLREPRPSMRTHSASRSRRAPTGHAFSLRAATTTATSR